MSISMCEDCVHFSTDLETGEEYCAVDLDEDDMAQFTAGIRNRCPYYHPGNEYDLVRKQN